MTDNEIIKALARCYGLAPKDEIDCALCPYCNYDAHTKCCEELIKDSLDLIERQKAEIERYEKEHQEKFDKWLLLDKRTKERYAELYDEAKIIVRAKAIREFAERLKASLDISACGYSTEEIREDVFNTIDSLVEEMVGDSE